MIKKSTIFGLSLALALSGLWSCEKGVEETVTDAPGQTVTLTLKSTLSEQTRTTISLDGTSGKYKPVWDENEHIGVFVGDNKNMDFDNAGVAGTTTEFFGEAELSAGNYKIYTYYPFDGTNTGSNEPEDTRITLPTVQHPSLGSFDARADIMVGYPLDLALSADENTPVLEGLRFKRLMATLQIIPSAIAEYIGGEPVTSIRLAAEDATLTGRVKIDLTAGEILPGGFYSSGNYKCDYVTAEYDAADNFQLDGTSSALVVVNPTTVAAGKTITLEIKTPNYKITKTATLASDMSFAAGEVTPLRMNLANGTVIENTSVGKALPFEEDFAECTSGNSTSSGGSSTQWKGNDNFAVVATAYQAGSAVRLGSGSANGTLTTEKLNLSQAFTVIVTGKGWSASENSMTVTAGSQSQDCTFTTFMTGEWETKYLYFESAGNAGQVSFVTSKRLFIDGIRIVNGKVTPPAELNVNTEPIDVPAAGAVGEIKYTVNFDDDVTASCDGTVVTVATADGNGTVTYTVSENTTPEAREGWIAIESATAGKKFPITIRQAGANATMTYTVVYTVVSTSSVTAQGNAPEGSFATFKSTYSSKEQLTSGNSATLTLSGYDGATIKSVVLSMHSNASKGNGSYEIKVGSAAIATQSDAAFNKWEYNNSFGTSYRDIDTHANETTVPDGEEIVITIKASANSLYIQSYTITYEYAPSTEPKLTAGDIPEVAAAGVTAATFEYTVKNFTDDVVATCDGTVVTVATADGNGKVTYTVAENTAEELREGWIKLSSASTGLTVDIAVKQKGANSEGEDAVWTLVTDASTLAAGDQIVIVCKDKNVAAGDIASSVMSNINCDFSENNTIAELPEKVVILTLGGMTDAWTFSNSDSKLLGATAVKKLAWGTGTTTWKISIASNGDATIQNTTSSYGTLKYNSSSPRFTTYASGQMTPQIFRLQ